MLNRGAKQPRPKPGLTCAFLERMTRLEPATFTLARRPDRRTRVLSSGGPARSAGRKLKARRSPRRTRRTRLGLDPRGRRGAGLAQPSRHPRRVASRIVGAEASTRALPNLRCARAPVSTSNRVEDFVGRHGTDSRRSEGSTDHLGRGRTTTERHVSRDLEGAIE